MDAHEPTSLSAILRSYPFRLGAFGLLTLVVYQAIYQGVVARGVDYMGRENGPLELAQATLAIAASLCLFHAARRVTVGKAGLVVCAALAGYAGARESDSFLESMFFNDAYKWLFGLPLFSIAAVVCFTQRRKLIPETMWLMRQPAATAFFVAGIYLCGVCQVFDRPALWMNHGTADQAAATKAFVEEFAELFAYMLLSFSAIEAVVLAYQAPVATAADRGEPTIRLAA